MYDNETSQNYRVPLAKNHTTNPEKKLERQALVPVQRAYVCNWHENRVENDNS